MLGCSAREILPERESMERQSRFVHLTAVGPAGIARVVAGFDGRVGLHCQIPSIV